MMQNVPKIPDSRLAEDDLVREHARATRARGRAVIATDTSGRILYWNDAAEQLYGWKREEVLNLNIVDVTPARLSRPEAAHIMKILRGGDSWSGTFQVNDRDGSRFVAAVTDNPVFNENGKLIGIIGISTRAPAPGARRQASRG
jgi:PAS domain S-box-containing protein